MSIATTPTRRVTTATRAALRQRGEPAVWIIAYDYRDYAADVRAARFPAPELCYPIDDARAAELRAVLRPRIEVAS